MATCWGDGPATAPHCALGADRAPGALVPGRKQGLAAPFIDVLND